MNPFNRKAALQYVKDNQFEVPAGVKDGALIRIIMEALDKQPYQCTACSTKGEIHFVREEDTFCWYCGDKMTEEDETIEVTLETVEEVPDEVENKEPETPEVQSELVLEIPSKTAVQTSYGNDVIPRKASKLDAKVVEIKTLEAKTGANAWKIGKLLQDIMTGNDYSEKYTSFNEFCNTELDYEKDWAYNLIRISELFTLDEASNIGVKKLTILTDRRLSPTKQKELLQLASSSISCRGLSDAVKMAVSPASKETALGGELDRPKAKKSPLKALIGATFVGKWDKENENCMRVVVDDLVHMVVEKDKNGLKLTFVEVGSPEDDEDA